MRESALFRAIQTSIQGAGLPYGYALTVWSTGAVLVGEHGKASPRAVFLFAAGAITAYGALKAITWNTEREAEKPIGESPRPVRAGFMHVGAIALAIGAALAAAQIPGDASWLLAPFLSTLLYLAGSSVEVALIEQDLET